MARDKTPAKVRPGKADRKKKAGKKRVDMLLVERGLAESRSRAQALCLAGLVFSADRRIDKAGQPLPVDAPLEVRGRDHPWVSRGGLKLDHALKQFPIPVSDAVAIDVGASTGGFTDVLLHHGARRVYAVDVGHGQLHWKLRNDERVVVLEKCNARHLNEAQVPEMADLVVCDASFIGLRTVLPAALARLRRGGWLVALIKPQFEVGREQVGKGGVVRDPSLHEAVCDTIRDWLENQPGWFVHGICESPITGPEGNKEFLIVAEKGTEA